jgi:hypothetical protein
VKIAVAKSFYQVRVKNNYAVRIVQ